MSGGGRATLAPYHARWLQDLVPMWRASFEAGVGVLDPHPLAEQQQHFLSDVLPHNSVCLAVLDGQLVGFVAASQEAVSQLYVRVGFHRQGIGAQLLGWAKARSGGSLWLFTFARNVGARSFYERNGFVPVAHGFEPVWQLDDVKYVWSADTVRMAERGDIPAMHRIRRAVRENRLTSSVITEADYIPAIEDTGRGWVIESGGTVVAFAIANKITGNIWALFVEPEHEGQGHGRRLHEAMVSWLFAQGLPRLWLSTGTGTRAQRFYEAAGWRFAGALGSGEAMYELFNTHAL